MGKNISNIHDVIVQEFRPFADEMASNGCSTDEIMRSFRTFVSLRKRKARQKTPIRSVGDFLQGTKFFERVMGPNKASADSNAERRLYDLLNHSKIKFKFQYRIGPYRADFLVNDLVVELDGPHHEARKDYDIRRDDFMRERGYRILRIPVMVLNIDPTLIISEIRELTG